MKGAQQARSVCFFIFFFTLQAHAQSFDPPGDSGWGAEPPDFPRYRDLAPLASRSDERFAKSLDVSATGLTRASAPWPRMLPQDKELDIVAQPWEGLGLKTGVKLSEPWTGGSSTSLSWAFDGRRPLGGLAPVSIGIATSGSLDVTGRTMSQTLAGSVAWNALSSLPGPVAWQPEVKLTPQMVFDGTTHAWTISMVPEIAATAQLARPGSSYRTQMSVRVSTALTPRITPATAALLEIKFVPSR